MQARRHIWYDPEFRKLVFRITLILICMALLIPATRKVKRLQQAEYEAEQRTNQTNRVPAPSTMLAQ